MKNIITLIFPKQIVVEYELILRNKPIFKYKEKFPETTYEPIIKRQCLAWARQQYAKYNLFYSGQGELFYIIDGKRTKVP